MITYDKYYQTPRMWLLGYDEVGSLFPPLSRSLLLALSHPPSLTLISSTNRLNLSLDSKNDLYPLNQPYQTSLPITP